MGNFRTSERGLQEALPPRRGVNDQGSTCGSDLRVLEKPYIRLTMCLEMSNLILLALKAENGKADRFPIKNKVSRTSSASAMPCV